MLKAWGIEAPSVDRFGEEKMQGEILVDMVKDFNDPGWTDGITKGEKKIIIKRVQQVLSLSSSSSSSLFSSLQSVDSSFRSLHISPPVASPFQINVYPPICLRLWESSDDSLDDKFSKWISAPFPSSSILDDLELLVISEFGWTTSVPPRKSIKFYFYPEGESYAGRIKIESFKQYLMFLASVRTNHSRSHIWIYLEPLNSNSDNKSPFKDRPPPRINTKLANETKEHPIIIKGSKSSPSSSSSLSPPNSNSPSSDTSPRDKYYRHTALHRDYDEDSKSHYCVFCRKPFGADYLEGAHLIPHEDERFGMEFPPSLVYIHSSLNVVMACKNCHNGAFDKGKFWVERNTEGKLVSVVHPDFKDDSYLAENVNGMEVRIPHSKDPEKMVSVLALFPPKAAWEWRKEWAQRQVKHEKEKEQKKLEEKKAEQDAKETEKKRKKDEKEQQKKEEKERKDKEKQGKQDSAVVKKKTKKN